MFHLGGMSFPASREQLISAVTEGLRELVTLAPGRETVKFEGGNYPAFDRVIVDLTGARSAMDKIPPEPRGVGQRQPGPTAGRFEVVAHPLFLRTAALDLSLTAANARFDYDRDAGGRPVLVLMDARDGHVTLSGRKQDLDALVLAGAKEAAARQGIQIADAQLTLAQIGDRSFSADVRVKAKKLFVTATVHIRGKLTVDDTLNAKIFDLSCAGEGVMGEMACTAIRPQLQKMNGQTLPLTALSLGQVRLRDVRMQVGETILLTAAFGS